MALSKRVDRILRIIGWVAFIIGALVALVAGIVAPANTSIIVALVILGIIVGALNVTSKELALLLIAAVAMMVIGTAGFEPLNTLWSGLGDCLNSMVNYLARMIEPAALIAAVRAWVGVGLPGENS